jgi:hypothetical protein
MNSERVDDELQVPLLGGENDIDHKIEQVSLLGLAIYYSSGGYYIACGFHYRKRVCRAGMAY